MNTIMFVSFLFLEEPHGANTKALYFDESSCHPGPAVFSFLA